MDDMPSFDEFNPIKFIYDLFFHMIDFVHKVYDFLTYDISIPKSVDVGIWDYELEFMDDLPDKISMIEFLGGTGVTIILLLVFLKIIIPVF